MEKEKMYHQEVNCTTGETIEREYTAEEYAQFEIDKANFLVLQAEAEAEAEAKAELKASARAKLISGTPLTEEEAAVLVI
jgi:phosphoribosylformylglycinamidine (FGAM) synthase PurS component